MLPCLPMQLRLPALAACSPESGLLTAGAPAPQAPSAGSPASRAQASLQVQQALEGTTRLAKGFSLPLCTRSRPKIGALLQQPLQTALQAPLVLPTCPALQLWRSAAGGAPSLLQAAVMPPALWGRQAALGPAGLHTSGWVPSAVRGAGHPRA